MVKMEAFTHLLVLLVLVQFLTLVHCNEDKDETETYEDCDAPYFGNSEPQTVPDNLLQMGPNSKYFLFSGIQDVPLKEANAMCAGIGLAPVAIRNSFEFTSIESYLNKFAPENTIINLGATDDKREGEFVESDGSPITFHNFAESQPDNRMNMENCLVLSRHPVMSRWVYIDVDCDVGVTPMCMFPIGSKCFRSSPLSGAKITSGFQYVGSSPRRDYYVGMKQLPRIVASGECEKSGYTLVDFNTGLNNNQMLYDLVRKWINKNYVYTRISFWTGGELGPPVPGSSVSTYQFQSSGKFLHNLTDWPSLSWDLDEPSDSSGLSLENCISSRLYKPYSASEDNIFHLSTTNCRLPHYPLCYKDKPTQYRNTSKGQGGLKGRSSLGKTTEYCKLDEIKLDLTLPCLSYSELVLLATVSRHNELSSDNFRFPWAVERPWLSQFIDSIFVIGKKVMQPELVPNAWPNIMYNMIILYYNAIENIPDPSEEALKYIETETDFLKKCSETATQLQFETIGGLPVKLSEGIAVNPPIELIDVEDFDIDLVLESYWFYFQTAVGSCHPQAAPSRTKWLADIHHVFVKYFLGDMFENRWASDLEDPVQYGVFVGDLDIDTVMYTLRVSAKGAFDRSNISELYFPRPMFLPNNYNYPRILNEVAPI